MVADAYRQNPRRKPMTPTPETPAQPPVRPRPDWPFLYYQLNGVTYMNKAKRSPKPDLLKEVGEALI
jgi:hypothetical protein